ncbi:lysine N-methyltransferase [Aureococcus anophagefferens]|nr:lysine N-methyltransferase [Aureococcus anophagefferens]
MAALVQPKNAVADAVNAADASADDVGASEDGVLHLKSTLGTQQHWDDHYARERDNFAADEDDEGVDWFSENVGSRLLQWVEDHAQPGGSVLDLGCGSGVFLLGVEESFEEADITKLEALDERFDLVCDKGTFDAYMLGDGASVRAYATSVAAAVAPGGVFLLTSCNNTAEELIRHFAAANADTWGGGGASPFSELDRVRR